MRSETDGLLCHRRSEGRESVSGAASRGGREPADQFQELRIASSIRRFAPSPVVVCASFLAV